MKTRLLICLACCLVLFACSDDDSPTGPDSGAIAKATIGPDGGSLGDGRITVTIAAGALAGDTLLEIFEEDAAPGSGLPTGIFRLDGLTGACALDVSLATTAAATGSPAIQLTTPASSALAAATLTGGTLQASFAPAARAGAKAAMPVTIHGIADLSDQTVSWNDVDVRARVPADRADGAALHLETLRTVVQALLATGFEDRGHDEAAGMDVVVDGVDVVVDPRREAPLVRVLFDAQDQFVDAQGHDATVVLGHAALNPANLPTSRGQAAVDLGALVAGLTVSDEHDPANRLAWLPLACGRWVAWGWNTVDVELPALSDDQIRSLFDGVYHGAAPGLDPSVESFGSAMSAFLYWAAGNDQQGLDFVPALARASSSDAPTPGNLADAFEGIPSSSWWHGFVRDLAGGEVMPVRDEAFFDPVDGVFVIDVPSDANRVFTADYRQLSARVYSVRLNTDGFDETSVVRFSLAGSSFASSHLQLHAFKRLGGELIHLASGQDLTIGGLPALRTAGAHLALVVSCSELAAPYDGENEATLQIAFRQEQPGSPYSGHRCTIAWDELIEHIRWAGNGCPGPEIVNFERSLVIEDGVWNGYTYSAEFEVVTGLFERRDHGSIIVTMDDLVDQVSQIQLEWTIEENLESGVSSDYLHLVWQGGDLARDPDGSWPLSYELTGTAVVDHLSIAHTVGGYEGDCIQHHVSLQGEAGSSFTVGFSP